MKNLVQLIELNLLIIIVFLVFYFDKYISKFFDRLITIPYLGSCLFIMGILSIASLFIVLVFIAKNLHHLFYGE